MSRITSDVETITPQLASDYLKFNLRNRAYNRLHARSLAEQIKKGLWILDGNPIRFDENGILIDGQHRLNACIIAQLPIISLVVRGLPSDSFQNIDTGKIRSGGDILSIEGCQNATTISGSIVKYLNLKKGNQIIYGTTSAGTASNIRNSISKPEILQFYRENKMLCDAIGKHAASCGRGRRGVSIFTGTFIGGYELYLILEKNHSQEIVFSFFDQLITGEDIENRTIITLRNIMLRFNTGQHPLTAKQRIAYLTKTWNAYICSKELQVLTYRSESDENLDFI